MSLDTKKAQMRIMKLIEQVQLSDLINVADIGAASINETPVYSDLVMGGYGHLFAFDGDSRQIPALRKLHGDHATVLNHFLADGDPHTAYICREDTGMTSLLKPNQTALAFFNNFSLFGKVLKEKRVQTTRLDDIDKIGDLHFVKMDVQGSELNILKNGLKKLSNCVAIQLEVSFICLYENQPGLGEIDMWMRSIGFAPHRFLDIKRWSITPTINGNNFRRPFNQLLEADIVYVRDPLNMKKRTSGQLKMLAVMSEVFFDSPDLAIHCMRELVSRKILDTKVISQFIAARAEHRRSHNT